MSLVGCPACRSASFSVHVETPKDREYFVNRAAPAAIVRCSDCRSLYQMPWPTATETDSFYTSDYQNYITTKAPLVSSLFKWNQRRAARTFIQKNGVKASVLDFGCNQGFFLRSLYEAGARSLVGFDVVSPSDPEALSRFRFTSSLESLRDSGERFDVIRMNHVIEHLADLDAVMKLLASLLTAAGRIIGQTPNAGHYTSYLMKAYWGPLHYPYHCLIFSSEGMSEAAKRWGLCLRSTATTIQPTGWAMTVENFLKPLTHPKLKGRSPFYAFYLLASLPFVGLDSVTRLSGTAIMDFELARSV